MVIIATNLWLKLKGVRKQLLGGKYNLIISKSYTLVNLNLCFLNNIYKIFTSEGKTITLYFPFTRLYLKFAYYFTRTLNRSSIQSHIRTYLCTDFINSSRLTRTTKLQYIMITASRWKSRNYSGGKHEQYISYRLKKSVKYVY